MRFDVFTIFPGIFEGPLRETLLGRAIEAGILQVLLHDIRDWTSDRHRQVDDVPYGGGPGMVMKPEPIVHAVESLGPGRGRTLILSPAGRRLDQALVRELSAEPALVMVCGRYEGIDERAVEILAAEEISIGDYVLSGGELPALVILEAVTRLLPGAIGSSASHERDSFGVEGGLDHPQFTRPRMFRGLEVPPILLSGDHAEIERWRGEAATEKLRRNRPDLLGR
ncbi:MAG: tRNA (guanosine(37)-N1)-methyltransferase TrmD [Actinomycetota bacterium]